MPTQLYAWERIWLPVELDHSEIDSLYPLDRTGYLDNHRFGRGLVQESIGHPLRELAEQGRCLVLLGEPGMGKSHEWKQQERVNAANTQHVFFNLGGFSSEEALRTAVHEHPAVQQWIADDTSTLWLWLDSLDEGLLRIDVLKDTLLRVMATLPCSRLALRVLCRNAVWPVGFSEQLQQVLGQNQTPLPSVEFRLLAPLSQAQVRQAAEQEFSKEQAEEFLTAVDAANAVPLAVRPVTLALLLNLFRRFGANFGGAGVASRAELYYQGCLLLCEKPDKDRPEKDRKEPRSRLLLAGHVALLTVLGNRRVIRTEAAAGSLLETELEPYDVGGGRLAGPEGTSVDVTQANLRDLWTNTSLFVAAGAGRVTWAHQSYAEFLAAWYLNLVGMSTAQLRPIFRSAADPTGGIVPALQETAAWLAALNPTFWDELVNLDPLALLQADLRVFTPQQRYKLVDRMLAWHQDVAYVKYTNRDFLQYLNHPQLSAQLAPVLADAATPIAVARFVYDLVEICQLTALQGTLVHQCLDPNFPFRLRIYALEALASFADPTVNQQLRPLLQAIPDEDVQDEFRGHLLALLWPTHISADELFPLLTPRKKTNLYGAYHTFLESLKHEAFILSPESVLDALTWLNDNLKALDRNGWLQERIGQVDKLLFAQAWQLLDHPGIAELLAVLYTAAVKRHYDLLIPDEAAPRLVILRQLLQRTDLPAASQVTRGQRPANLVRITDWEALLLLFDEDISDDARNWLADVCGWLLWDTVHPELLPELSPQFVTRFGEIYELAVRYPLVLPLLKHWWDAREVGEPYAVQERERLAENKRVGHREFRKRQRHRIARRNSARIRGGNVLLRKALSGSTEDWNSLQNYYADRYTRIKNQKKPFTIQQFFNWDKQSAQRQQELLILAMRCVQLLPQIPVNWNLPGYNLTRGAWMAYRSLWLCYDQATWFVEALPAQFWQNWTSLLLEMSGRFDNDAGMPLLQLAAAHVPAAVDAAIIEDADAYDHHDSIWHQFGKFCKALPNAGFTAQLLERIIKGQWQERQTTYVLLEMLKRDYLPAWQYVPILLSPPDNQEPSKTASAVLRWLLFEREADARWWAWWQQVTPWPDFVANMASGAIQRISPRPVPQLAVLTEQQLIELALWLTTTYKLQTSDVDDWENNTRQGQMAVLRTATVTELATRGTADAWAALQQVQQQVGADAYWVRFRLDQVRENLRRNAWQPLMPDELLLLVHESNRRWIQNGNDLLDVLEESLQRLQIKLHGELQAARFLWNQERAGKYKKKYTVRIENDLSDFIRLHLAYDIQERQLLIKREVEVRASDGKGTGQRTDIYVDAIGPVGFNGQAEIITAIIEVKLSRNDEMDTGIHDQLLPYLQSHSTRHGLFLVGWHFGEHDTLSRAAELPSKLALLSQQAQQASSGGVFIRASILDIRLPSDNSRTV